MYVPILKEDFKVSRFIDFDKSNNIFYNNFYLSDCKIVIKIHLTSGKNSREEVKIEKFNLTKYTYLLSY